MTTEIILSIFGGLITCLIIGGGWLIKEIIHSKTINATQAEQIEELKKQNAERKDEIKDLKKIYSMLSEINLKIERLNSSLKNLLEKSK